MKRGRKQFEPVTLGDWRMRVLVVEDNPRAAASLAELLRREGHEVDVAGDGFAAVTTAQERAPDAVLLDLGLPGMDGWQVARLLRELPGAKRPLMVAVTGLGAEEDRRLSEQAGIDLHLTKPVDAEGLRRLLARFRSIISAD
jgi:CheY-like chemotaxis protein